MSLPPLKHWGVPPPATGAPPPLPVGVDPQSQRAVAPGQSSSGILAAAPGAAPRASTLLKGAPGSHWGIPPSRRGAPVTATGAPPPLPVGVDPQSQRAVAPGQFSSGILAAAPGAAPRASTLLKGAPGSHWGIPPSPAAPPRPFPPAAPLPPLQPTAQASPGTPPQGAPAPRTVTLGKSADIIAMSKGNTVKMALALHNYCAKAATCDRAFKSNGDFQGFVNGYVDSNGTPEQKIEQIKRAYLDYRDCGLAAAAAQEIKAGIAGFADRIDARSFDPVKNDGTPLIAAGCESVRAACNQYLDKAWEAYPGLFTVGEKSEQEALQKDIIDRSLALIEVINRTADPRITVAEAANLIKENLDKILYQQFRDQSMITGSDHGIHHIVMGNIRNSLAVLGECKDGAGRCVVTPQEMLMVLQAMVDHDLGYTTFASQADFGASKDHPLASRAYVDQNINPIFRSPSFQPPQIKYGAEDFIKSSILSHSYPAGLDQPLDFTNNRTQSLRNVVAVVDAMGTTQDTKLPSVFRQPKIQEQLFRVGLEKLTHDPKRRRLQELQKKGASVSDEEKIERDALADQLKGIDAELQKTEQRCRNAMLQAINDTSDVDMPPGLKARYKQAIEVDFSAQGAGMVVPQFAGKLLHAGAISQATPGQYKMDLGFEVSLPERLAQSITGQADIAVQDRLNAFNKMAQDIAQRNVGGEIDDSLYGRGASVEHNTCSVQTNLIDFTFQRSSTDTNFLRSWFAQDIDTY